RQFYGPEERYMFLSGLFRPSVWKSYFRSTNAGFEGNFKGEGRILGGVIVMGAGDEGILLQHQEKEFGDHVEVEDVRKAIQKINEPVNSQL
ncbi:hypothetical protein QZH41_010027, partial [Actinostola sp. cb2023]